jgi:glycosyltransferase involved in cell wall biosynthesis
MELASFCISTSWDDSVAGHFRALAGELAARGHRVFLFVDQRRDDIVDPNANPAVLTWPSRRPTHVPDAVWFGKFVLRERPHALVANWGATNVMLAVGRLIGVSVRVGWYHTLHGQLLADGGLKGVTSRLRVWRKRLVFRAATHFATASDAAKTDLASVYGVRLERITTLGLSFADPGLSSSPPNRPEVVCVGRLHLSKGQDVLLRALALLPESVGLVLVGNGPALAFYQALSTELGIAHRCRFVGTVPLADVPAFMARASVTVVPSRQEAFGMVNIESLAVGTPVVATRVGGIPEIVRDGLDGLLVPPDDATALAAAIGRVLETPGLRDTMSANGRQRFVHRYEQRAVVTRQADWLEALTSRRATPPPRGRRWGGTRAVLRSGPPVAE